MSSFTLEEYRIQREYRQNKRKQYLKRFELLKQKIPINFSTSTSVQRNQIPHERVSTGHIKKAIEPVRQYQERISHSNAESHSVDLSREVEQNKHLKQELQQIQSQQRKKLTEFKQQISSIKQKYIHQIKSISALAHKNKEQTGQKMKKILQQMQNGVKKNQQIKNVNNQLKKQLLETDSTMGTYTTEIKNQYAKKLHEFEKIFNTSNEKIQEMEKQFNEEEFVNNALGNEDLIKTIQQNATRSEEAIKILDDYKELLTGKTQILKQINSNIQMKENQLTKMAELQGKMKTIFQKMNQEKKSYIVENQRMTKQLMQVKDLIMGFMNQAEQAQQNAQN